MDSRTEWQRFVDATLQEHDKRLTEAEKEYAVYKALQEEQRKYLNDRFNRMQDNINQTRADLTTDVTAIKSGINRILWAVGLAMLAGLLQFVLNGGLKVVQ